MKWLLEIPIVGALFLFGFIPGLSGMFLIEAAIALVLVGASTSIANSKGMLPGTASYRNRIAVESAEAGLQIDRITRTRTRIQMLENEDVAKMLEAGKADA